MSERYEIVEYRHNGSTVYGLQDNRSGRMYGPYWRREHLDAALKHVISKPQGDRASSAAARAAKYLTAVLLVGVLSYVCGVSPHEFLVVSVAGIFFTLVA